jgi:hypothetical protein
MENEPKMDFNTEEEPSLEETLKKSKEWLEKAKTSTGRDRSRAVFECEGRFVKAGLRPEDLQKIGTTREELNDLVLQGDKEEATELLEKARSSRGREKSNAARQCKTMLKSESSKRKEIKRFTPEDIGTSLEELDEMISQGEEEKP